MMSTGTGKADSNDEEGWTQLPDGTILTVDANRDLGTNNDYTGSTTVPTDSRPRPSAISPVAC